MNPPLPEPHYIISIEEVVAGLVLMTLTILFHGFGMTFAARCNHALQKSRRARVSDVLRIVVIVWIIVTTHMIEIGVWAAFLVIKGAFPNTSIAYYFTLMQYTTVGSSYQLPERWRLLEGIIAIAGMLTFSWSTAIMFRLTQDIQDRRLRSIDEASTSAREDSLAR